MNTDYVVGICLLIAVGGGLTFVIASVVKTFGGRFR